MPKGRTKSAQQGGSSLAAAFKRIGSRVKKRREGINRSTYKVPQEIVIFGERVRMFQDTSTETSLGFVAFREEYFPTDSEPLLQQARVTFAKIFGAGSKFILEFPTYPCDETDRYLLRQGLVNRWTGLREEITQAQAGAIDMATAVLNERVERFGKLTSLINTMDEIYKANSANCFTDTTPGAGPVATAAPMEKMDERKIRELLRKFTFLILQAQKYRSGYDDTIDATKIVREVAQVDMDQDTMNRYVHEYGEGKIPPVLMGLATGTTSVEILTENRNSAEMGALLNTFNEEINTFLAGASRLSSMERNTFIEYQTEFQTIIGDTSLTPSEKITKGVKFILRVHRDLIVAARRLRSTAESEQGKSSKYDNELKKIQLREATLNEEVKRLKTQIESLKAARTAATAGLADKGRTIQSLNEQLRLADVKKQGQLAGVQAALAAAQADRERIQGAKAAAETAAARAEKDRSGIEERLQALNETNRRLQEELTGSKAEIAGLTAALQKVQTQKDEIQANLDQALQRDATQTQKINDAQREFKTQMTELQRKQQDALETLNEKHKAELVKRSSDIAAGRARSIELEMSLNELQQKIATERRVIALNALLLKQNEKERARLAQEAEEAKNQIASIKAAPAEQIDTAALNRLTKELEQINERAQDFETKNGALEAEIAGARAAAATASQEKEKIEDEKEEILKRIATIRSDFNEELTKAQQAATAAGQELEATKAAHIQEIQTLVENLERNQAEKLEALRTEAAGAATQKEDEIQRISEQLAAKEAEVATAKAALVAAQKAHTERIVNIERGHQKAISRISEEKARIEVDKNALQSQLEAQSRQVAGIRSQLEEAQATDAAAKTAAGDLQRQLEAAGANRAELEARIAAKQTEFAAANQRVQELQAALDAAKESVGQTQLRLSESETAYKDLDTKYKELASSSQAAQAAASKQREKYEGTLGKLEAQLAAGQQRLSELEGTSQASATEREQLAAKVKGLEEQITKVKEERDLAAGQIAAAQAAKSGAEAALEQGREAFQGQLRQAQEKYQQEMDGLFGNILALAEMVERDQMPKKGFQNQNFVALYERMKGLKESSAAAVRSSEQRSLCYLNYFVEYFLRQFFFLGESAEKEQIYKAIGDAITPIDDRILPSVVHNLFEGLKGEEEGQRAEALGATAALFGAVSDPAVKEKLNEYFLAGFPSHSDLMTREVFGQPYSVALSFFVVAARKYLLRISSELRAAQCGLSNFMMTPAAVPAPAPAGRERGVSLPMTNYTNIVSPRSRSSSTNTTRRLRRPAKMIANAAHAVAAREEEEARRLEARAQQPQ